jgi:N-acyl-D-aspartate/D-glutamate deacylase
MAETLKLAGGTVYDGTGAPPLRADVLVDGDRIVAVGDLGAREAATTLDCLGLAVAPGFIDIHSHADFLVPGAHAGRLVEPFVRQGVTTLIGGNCGFSPAPVTSHNHGAIRDGGTLITDDPLDVRWESMAGFLDGLAQTGLPLNLGQLVGHGAVRAAVTGPLTADAPSPEQLAAMERLVREALDAGCLGTSTGLGYAPGILAGHDELVAFARWTAGAGKLFTSHLRAYSRVSPVYQTDPDATPHNLQAVEELLAVGEAAGVRLQLSHLIFVGRRTWPTAERTLATIDAAHARGLDVAFDAFPYTAGNTTAAVIFPPEMLPHLESLLASPEAMEAMRAMGNHVFGEIGFSLEDIQLMRANAPAFEAYEGLFMGEAAARAGMDVWTFYARLVLESRRTARILLHTYSGAADDESALRAVLAHPRCTIETDTFVTARGHQNPASYGTFPRVLSTYVAAGLFPLAEAVRKMTGAAAERLGLSDRGVVRAGAAADLVVFDPARLHDTASFTEPARFPTGIAHVLINGRQVLAGDRYDATARAGRVLRA